MLSFTLSAFSITFWILVLFGWFWWVPAVLGGVFWMGLWAVILLP